MAALWKPPQPDRDAVLDLIEHLELTERRFLWFWWWRLSEFQHRTAIHALWYSIEDAKG